MKNWTVLLFTALISLPALAVEGGHSEGNGGGGVIRDGRAMTFYSAGLVTEQDEEDAADVPGLNELVQRIYQMPYFTKSRSAALISALRPTAERRYFRVKEKYFDGATEARIREEYVRAMHIERPEVALFAVTDSNSKTTYLLPAFYGLRPVEQMAILFHEAFWVAWPNSKYSQVISAETKMQAFLESGDNKKLLKLIGVIGSRLDYVKAALAMDQQSGALKPLLDKNGDLPMATLLGKDVLNCLRRDDVDYDCRDNFKLHLIELAMQNSQSMLLPALAEQLDRSNTNLAISSELNWQMDREHQSMRTMLRWHHDRETYYGSDPYSACELLSLRQASVPLKIDESLGAFVSRKISVRTAPKPKALTPAQRQAAFFSGGYSDPGACNDEKFLIVIENRGLLDDPSYFGG